MNALNTLAPVPGRNPTGKMEARPRRRKVLSRGVQAPGMQAQPRRRRVPTPRRRGALVPNGAGARPETTHNSRLSRRSSGRRHPTMLPSAPRSHPRRTRGATTEAPPPRTSKRRPRAARRRTPRPPRISKRRPRAARRRTPRPRPVRRTVRTSRRARALAGAAASNYAYPWASVNGTYAKGGSSTSGAVRASSLTTRTTHAKTLPRQLRLPPTPSFGPFFRRLRRPLMAKSHRQMR